MKRYDENQGYRWWSWMKYLWEDVFDKVENKIFDMKNEVLAALVGLPVIPTMILTFGVLSLVMLIPHTFEWAYLSLIRKVDNLLDDHEKPFEISFIQVLLIFTTLVVALPFFVWIGPKALYLHIKDKSGKRTRMEWDRLERERNLQREIRDNHEPRCVCVNCYEGTMASVGIIPGNGPEIRRQPKPDFAPKKRMKAHSLKDKKEPTLVSPGVYLNEREYSVTTHTWETYGDYLRRERDLAIAREELRINRQMYNE
jgi:hypothetical protein